MSSIADYLPPHRTRLDLREVDFAAALDTLLEGFRGDAAVRDFEGMRRAVLERPLVDLDAKDCAIRLAHGRTECVERLVMAVGRLGVAGQPGLLFLAAIPSAFNAEYLRAVGLIARACQSPARREALVVAASPAEFTGLLREIEI